MRKPTKPYYSDFGLTESHYNDIGIKQEKFDKMKAKYEETFNRAWNIARFVLLIPFIAVFLNFQYFNKLLGTDNPIFIIFILWFIYLYLYIYAKEYLSRCCWYLAQTILAKKHIHPPKHDELKQADAYDTAFNEYKEELDKYNLAIQKKKQDYWYKLDGWEFEKEFAKLLDKNGYDTMNTRGSGDEGVDIYAQKNNVSYIVQCKAHKNPVGPSVIRDLYGTLVGSKCDVGILVNLGGFTQGVFDFVEGKPILLLDISDVVNLNAGNNSSLRVGTEK